MLARRSSPEELQRLMSEANVVPDLPTLQKGLAERDSRVRAQAAGLLGYVGQAALGDIQRALSDNQAEVQAAAARSALRLPALPQQVVELVFDLARAEAIPPETAAALLLRAEDTALPLLMASTRDAHDMVQVLAIGALGRPEFAPSPALPRLTALLDAADLQQQSAAIGALGAMGPSANSAVPKLRQLLSADDQPVRFAAAVAISQVVPGDSAPLPVLVEALDSPDAILAAQALGRLGSAAEEAVPQLAARLTSADQAVQLAIIECLAELGPSGRGAAEALTEIANSPASIHRGPAAAALGAMAPYSKHAIPTLVDLLAEPQHSATAAAALARFGHMASSAVGALTRLAQEGDPESKIAALRALGRIGSAAAPALPVLENLLAQPEYEADAATALGWMGPSARPAVPKLQAQIRAHRERAAPGAALLALELALARIQPAADAPNRRPYHRLEQLPEGALPGDASAALDELLKLLQDKKYADLEKNDFGLQRFLAPRAAGGEFQAAAARWSERLIELVQFIKKRPPRLFNNHTIAAWSLTDHWHVAIFKEADKWHFGEAADILSSVVPPPPADHRAMYEIELFSRVKGLPGSQASRSAAEMAAIAELELLGGYVAVSGPDSEDEDATAVYFPGEYYQGGDVGFSLLKKLTNLQALIIDSPRDVSPQAMQELAALTTLKSLRMPLVAAEPRLNQAWQKLNRLEVLELTVPAGSWNEQAELLTAADWTALTRLTNLQRLILGGEGIAGSGAVPTTRAARVELSERELTPLRGLTQLRELTLRAPFHATSLAVASLKKTNPNLWIEYGLEGDLPVR